MKIFLPKLLVLDSSTLGKISRDYWSSDEILRSEARSFLKRLEERGIFIVFSLTHIGELLRHEDDKIVRDRQRFLRSIPLIAWLRPYDRNWFAGSHLDLVLREIDVFLGGSARNWGEIANKVRLDSWETGLGSELFVEDDEFWSAIRRESGRLHQNEKHIASVARTDPTNFMEMKLSDAKQLSIRPKDERFACLRRYAQEMQRQLERHGDPRLEGSHEIARDFSKGILEDVEAIDEMEGDRIQRWLDFFDVPSEFVRQEMTIREIGCLGVYIKQLEIFGANLRPPIDLTIKDIPPGTLPSYVLEQKLRLIQGKADMVSGSDLGDANIAPLTLYADQVEVDKRTNEFLNQLRRNEPELGALMCPYFKISDYRKIPELFDD